MLWVFSASFQAISLWLTPPFSVAIRYLWKILAGRGCKRIMVLCFEKTENVVRLRFQLLTIVFHFVSSLLISNLFSLLENNLFLFFPYSYFFLLTTMVKHLFKNLIFKVEILLIFHGLPKVKRKNSNFWKDSKVFLTGHCSLLSQLIGFLL